MSWLSMLPQETFEYGETEMGGYWTQELEAPARPVATPRRCDNRSLPSRGPVRPVTRDKVRCARVVFGVTNPPVVVAAAAARAVEMLDNTIGELTNGRNRVCQGEPPAWPLLGDLTLVWLRDRLGVCVDDIGAWTAHTYVNRSVAEVIRRLTRVRNLIASNAIRYECNGGGCNPGDPPVCDRDTWAFICQPCAPSPDPTECRCPPGAMPSIIHLCRSFWVPGVHDGKPVNPKVHAEFQAQTIIHEASHLYHCTSDRRGSTIGVAECLAQFVAVTNGSPIDSDFAARCRVTKRCARPAATGQARELEISGARPRPQRMRVVKTVFRPQNAIRLKGRPAVRR